MSAKFEDDVFKDASTTFYYSTRFFPQSVRRDIFKLYGFIKVIRDYVDLVPARPDHIASVEYLWSMVRDNPEVAKSFANPDDPNELIVRDMAELQLKYKFDPAWTESYFASMHMDLYGRSYETIADTLQYTYGSSEVLGRYIAQILRVHPDAHYYAQVQGRAMQYLNFIRDAAEDAALGRNYFPQEDMRTFGLKDLTSNTVYQYPVAYKDFMAQQLSRYREWQHEANEGFRYVKRRNRIAVRTAIDMYEWTASQIEANPLIVYEKKPGPEKWQVVRQGLFRTYYG